MDVLKILKIPAVTLVSLILSGCNSHEGTYSPSCIAFEGSNIHLNGGQFVWERFTDQVIVDDDGNVVDQYPEYPLRGSYRIDGHTVYMQSPSGEAIENMYMHRDGNRYYLMTRDQFTSWEETGRYADCVLTLEETALQ